MAGIQDNQNAKVTVECLATTSVPSYQIIAKQGELREVAVDVARYLVGTGKFVILAAPAPVIAPAPVSDVESVAETVADNTIEQVEAEDHPAAPKKRRKE